MKIERVCVSICGASHIRAPFYPLLVIIPLTLNCMSSLSFYFIHKGQLTAIKTDRNKTFNFKKVSFVLDLSSEYSFYS